MSRTEIQKGDYNWTIGSKLEYLIAELPSPPTPFIFFLVSNFSTQKITDVRYVTFLCTLRDAALKNSKIL